MDGEIYLWRDQYDPETILLGQGRENSGDDRSPDVAAFAAFHEDALLGIFGSAGYDVLSKIDAAGRPVCFSWVIPEME